MKSKFDIQPATQLRRGVSILELLVAGMAISAAAFIAVSAMMSVQINRRGTDRLQFASQELNNQLERISDLTWDELTPDRLSQIRFPESVADRVSGARLELSVIEVTQPHRAKKLTAQILWPDHDQETHPPLRLTTWVFAARETP